MAFSFYVDETETKRVTYTLAGEEHWVDLRVELSEKERATLDSSAIRKMSREADGEGGEAATFTVDFSDFRTRLLAAWITGWDITGKHGQRTKPTLENIRNLRKVAVDALFDVVTAHVESVDAASELITDPEPDGSTTNTSSSTNVG